VDFGSGVTRVAASTFAEPRHAQLARRRRLSGAAPGYRATPRYEAFDGSTGRIEGAAGLAGGRQPCAMPLGKRVNAELRAMGDKVPNVPDHAAEMGETGLAGERGVVDAIPGGLGGDGGTPG
jgi:hypothetical protein